MEAKAVARFVRISARKARLVADEVRGFDYLEAVDILKFTNKKAADLVLNVMNSAKANAIHADKKLNEASLYVKKIYVDEGPIMKRFRARARGRAARIRKKLSHITVVLSD
ncbi:MAG: 50S ribosomal protein L22 [Leptospiraceae bacterium]|nr:50S ribosomal protein L22 [Leptospiraceae bacterium]MCK6380135.1 50S ribosomal protein L22 [Leptospiraceae bacterium]NUM42880.1 50S ribosomal protein L22 [Leptospiraceae bacterium]